MSSNVVTIDVISLSFVLSPSFPTIETLAPVLPLFCREVTRSFSSDVRKLSVVNSPGANPRCKDYPAFTNVKYASCLPPASSVAAAAHSRLPVLSPGPKQ